LNNKYSIQFNFLAHLAKGKVSFCHHLASIIRHPLAFHILIFSSETPQPNELKLVSYQVSVYLAKRFQRRRFKKIVQSETRIVCGGHVC
jgi:hypothetical protein